MGLNTWIRDIVRTKLFPFGGTMSTPFDGDSFPTAIGNEILGGAHGYRTLEELADLPKLRMQRPMIATVLRHVRPDSTVFERASMILDPTSEIWDPFLGDATLEKISDISGYDLSLFWKPLDPKSAAAANNVIESQYADAQDYGRLGDPSTPAFLPPIISSVNYQAGKKSDVDSSIIWSDTYDPTIHKYERQRLGDNGNWGIPKLINATSYSQGDYLDNRFIWVLKTDGAPSRPPSLIGGISNGEPAGWQNTPEVPGGADYYEYIEDHDLYKISASKDTFGTLKSEWSTPQKMSTDPNLVRYGNNPSSTDFIGPAGEDTADWRGYFTPGTDTHMATRVNADSPWRIQNIDNEEGEYVDYIFKAFPLGDEPDEDDRPTISNPFSSLETDYPNNLWKDYPFTVEDDEILYRSVGRKFNNGQLKPSGWSIPTRADGKDTIQVVIEPEGATTFKYTGAGVVTPSTIVLKAKLYRGNAQVEPDVDFKWYKGAVDGSNQIVKDSVVGVSVNHVISGTWNDTLTISPEAVDNNQVYNAEGILSGENYIDPITILDVTDGIGIIAVIDSAGGFVFKNSEGSIQFASKLYSNGVEVTSGYTVKWFLGATEVATTGLLTVDASNFMSKEILKLEVTYDGNVHSRTETLVDISDAEETIVEYSDQNPLPVSPGDQVWTNNPAGAYYMRISTDGGVTFDVMRVRGENAPYNGGFQKSAYKNASGQPTATGVGSNLLPTSGGWTAQPTNPGPGEYVWEATAFFTKNVATSDTSLTSANWNIDGSWSTAIRKTGTDGDAEGPQGDPGAVGWSPEFALVTRSSDGGEVQRVVNWINLGGADPSTKPPTGYYVSVGGFTTDINAAKNLRGPAGGDANSRPMYYTSLGTKLIGAPTTLLNQQGTALYVSNAMEVKNTWNQSRYFRVIGEIPVSNDNHPDSWFGYLVSASLSSGFASNPESATRRDTNFTRSDYANFGTNPTTEKIKMDVVVSLGAGQSIYLRLGLKQNDGGASKYGQGFLEAYGL